MDTIHHEIFTKQNYKNTDFGPFIQDLNDVYPTGPLERGRSTYLNSKTNKWRVRIMNDEALLNAITKIAVALSQPSFFDVIAMVISGLSLITTIIIIILNYCAVKAAKESVEVAEKSLLLTKLEMQKAVDIQLYDRRLTVANHIEKDQYSDSFMEIALLFGNQICKNIESIKELISQLSYSERMHERYEELLSTYEDADEYRQLEEALNDASMWSSSQYEGYSKRYEELHQKYAIIYDYSTGEEVIYDIDAIYKEESRLDKEIKEMQKQLKEDILHIMRQKLSLEDKFQ